MLSAWNPLGSEIMFQHLQPGGNQSPSSTRCTEESTEVHPFSITSVGRHVLLTLLIQLVLPKLWLRSPFYSWQGNHLTNFYFSSLLLTLIDLVLQMSLSCVHSSREASFDVRTTRKNRSYWAPVKVASWVLPAVGSVNPLNKLSENKQYLYVEE